jgi:hypothetical protein
MLFGRKDEEMNVPRALEQPVLENRSASVGAAEVLAAGLNFATPKTADARIVEPGDSSDKSATPDKNSTGKGEIPVIAETAPSQQQQRPTLSSQETDTDVLARYAGVSSTTAVVKPEEDDISTATTTTAQPSGGGDPLGVSSDEPLPHRQQSQQNTRAGGVDFAAFARENAFRDS